VTAVLAVVSLMWLRLGLEWTWNLPTKVRKLFPEIKCFSAKLRVFSVVSFDKWTCYWLTENVSVVWICRFDIIDLNILIARLSSCKVWIPQLYPLSFFIQDLRLASITTHSNHGHPLGGPRLLNSFFSVFSQQFLVSLHMRWIKLLAPAFEGILNIWFVLFHHLLTASYQSDWHIVSIQGQHTVPLNVRYNVVNSLLSSNTRKNWSLVVKTINFECELILLQYL